MGIIRAFIALCMCVNFSLAQAKSIEGLQHDSDVLVERHIDDALNIPEACCQEQESPSKQASICFIKDLPIPSLSGLSFGSESKTTISWHLARHPESAWQTPALKPPIA